MDERAVPIPGDDRGRPGVLQVVVGDDEVRGAAGPELPHIPDLRLAGTDADDRIHLAIDSLLPACGVAIAIIIATVSTRHHYVLAIWGDVHLRDGHVHLREFVLVLRPRIERIADHDHAGQATLDLLLGNLVHVWVVPVHAHGVLVGRDRDVDVHAVAWRQLDVDIISLGLVGCTRSVVMEVGDELLLRWIVANGKLVRQVELEQVAAVNLQHRARKASRVRRAVGVELVGHGVGVVVMVLIREAAVDLLAAVEDRIGVEARRDHLHVGFEHAVLALDHVHGPQLCLQRFISRGEDDVFRRHHRPLLETLEVKLPLGPAASAAGVRAGGAGRSKPSAANHRIGLHGVARRRIVKSRYGSKKLVHTFQSLRSLDGPVRGKQVLGITILRARPTAGKSAKTRP